MSKKSRIPPEISIFGIKTARFPRKSSQCQNISIPDVQNFFFQTKFSNGVLIIRVKIFHESRILGLGDWV